MDYILRSPARMPSVASTANPPLLGRPMFSSEQQQVEITERTQDLILCNDTSDYQSNKSFQSCIGKRPIPSSRDYCPNITMSHERVQRALFIIKYHLSDNMAAILNYVHTTEWNCLLYFMNEGPLRFALKELLCRQNCGQSDSNVFVSV